MKRNKLMVILTGFVMINSIGISSAFAQSVDKMPIHRGQGGCSVQGYLKNATLEDVYRRCLLEGVTLTPNQERVVKPALQRFMKEIETTFFTNPRPTYEGFFNTVKPVLRANQAAQVRSHINAIMRGYNRR